MTSWNELLTANDIGSWKQAGIIPVSGILLIVSNFFGNVDTKRRFRLVTGHRCALGLVVLMVADWTRYGSVCVYYIFLYLLWTPVDNP